MEANPDVDWAGSKIDRRSTMGYYTMVGENLMSVGTWKNKKQLAVAISSSKAHYSAMALGACELFWLKILLYDLGSQYKGPIVLHSDSTSA